jgi:hypothetical protein
VLSLARDKLDIGSGSIKQNGRIRKSGTLHLLHLSRLQSAASAPMTPFEIHLSHNTVQEVNSLKSRSRAIMARCGIDRPNTLQFSLANCHGPPLGRSLPSIRGVNEAHS